MSCEYPLHGIEHYQKVIGYGAYRGSFVFMPTSLVFSIVVTWKPWVFGLAFGPVSLNFWKVHN